jgi:hypothetical protein
MIDIANINTDNGWFMDNKQEGQLGHFLCYSDMIYLQETATCKWVQLNVGIIDTSKQKHKNCETHYRSESYM